MPVGRSEMAAFPLLRAKWSEISKLSLCGSNRHLLLTLTTFAFLCYSIHFSFAPTSNEQPAEQEELLRTYSSNKRKA